ncbi:MAG: hypothetical protein ACJAXL_000047 [Alphaproteobacteria bacterium]|jgi:hypothetical protein
MTDYRKTGPRVALISLQTERGSSQHDPRIKGHSARASDIGQTQTPINYNDFSMVRQQATPLQITPNKLAESMRQTDEPLPRGMKSNEPLNAFQLDIAQELASKGYPMPRAYAAGAA